MSNKEFVDAIVIGNSLEAETAFKDVISTKVGDALENKRQEVAKTFVQQYKDQKEAEANDD